MTAKGAIAAGNPETAAAAAAVLEDGGNAFDAALAALCAACVTEPVLASLGGGGFLLARPEGAEPVLYDFFAQTPRHRTSGEEVDFFPIVADFGTAQQEFHIGMGSIATPGMIKGLFAVHGELGSMPMARIVEPAVVLARNGVPFHPLQAYIFEIVSPIYLSDASCMKVFGSRGKPDQLVGEGEILSNPRFADTLEALAAEGEDLFYRGEIGRQLTADCHRRGGYLSMEDLENYRVVMREPLCLEVGDAQVFTNPPPSTGGILIAFALELLKGSALGGTRFGGAEHLRRLASAMALTNKARIDGHLHDAGEDAARTLLDPDFVDLYRRQVLGRPTALRGTTQISVIDARGNAASLTLSNGEGCGYMVPGTGIVLNNLLGEEDINPHGFHRWPRDVRMCSMMAPSLVARRDGAISALGSGGSNRIRTAILQVLLNLLEFGMTVEDAVMSPRIHFENDLLSVETGFGDDDIALLAADFPNMERWRERNLFFGGVHTVQFDPVTGSFVGAGDIRRGGVTLAV
jgi:gamma-glutamyltranspeptidase / glutathione hydrolase